MAEKNIVFINDKKNTFYSNISDNLNKLNKKYNINIFENPSLADNYIKKIDNKGDKLVLIGCHENLADVVGYEYIKNFGKTHPKTKKILFSDGENIEKIKKGLNNKLDIYINEKKEEILNEKLFNYINKILNEYENEPKIEYSVGNIVFKQAETLHEKLEFLKLRYNTYINSGYKNKNDLNKEQNVLKMEWDKYDKGNIESLLLIPDVRYVIAKNQGECVGGSRIIDGICPLEEGICIEDGYGYKKNENFNLNKFRKNNVFTREISRLIVGQNHRSSNSVVLLGLFKMIEIITSEHNYMFCTSTENQKFLYQAIGFEQIGPKIKYSLKGEWIPMIRDRFKAINYPETIKGMKKRFHLKGLEPIPKLDINKWCDYSREINKEVIRKGYYSNGK